MLSEESNKCICAENQNQISANTALDFFAPRNNQMVLVARFNKDCPKHGYSVIEEVKEKEEEENG